MGNILISVQKLEGILDNEVLWQVRTKNVPRRGELVHYGDHAFKVLELLWNAQFTQVTVVVQEIHKPEPRGRVVRRRSQQKKGKGRKR